jgi:hypothetical protein
MDNINPFESLNTKLTPFQKLEDDFVYFAFFLTYTNGTQYYGYLKTLITSDYRSHDAPHHIFSGFQELFS